MVSEAPAGDSRRVAVDLRKLLAPAAIAVVGASEDTRKVGGEIVSNLKRGGYAGGVFPVNPRATAICEYPAYASVLEIPPADLAVVAVNAPLVPDVIRQCGEVGIPLAMVLSSGFGEAGSAGKALQKSLDEAIAASGVRVVGPNCIGLMNVQQRMFCGFGPGFRNHGLSSGPVAMVTQSGGFGFSVVGLCNHQNLGFSKIVSTGNESDVSTAEIIDHILDDDEIKVIVAYIEGVRDGRRLLEVGEKALERGKPILCWKVGNSNVARAAVASHTANLSAPYELFKAAFSRSGFFEIREIEDLVDVARGFLGAKIPKGRRVAIVTTSGGSGVLMADRCDEAQLTLPPPSATLLERISAVLPPHSAVANPIDLTAQVGDDAGRFNSVVKAFADDPAYDQVLVRYGSVQSPNARAWAEELASIARACGKPLLVAWSRVPDRSSEALMVLEKNSVPWFVTPGRAVTAAGALGEFAARREALSRAQRTDRGSLAKIPLDLPVAAHSLGERASKRIVAAYGIPTVRERLFDLEQIAELKRSPFPFPVVIKVESPHIPHKTEAGAVMTGIRSLSALKQGARDIVRSAQAYRADASIDGVLVQETCSGTEVILGAFVDASFGPVVILGLGGIYAELLKDVTRRFAPVSKSTAMEMVLELKAAPIFEGYRGMPALDIDALADAISRLSHLIAHHEGRISEIDINPVFVGRAGATVADALVVVKGES
jgi:acetate---CoA ligase (ADP-forming)